MDISTALQNVRKSNNRKYRCMECNKVLLETSRTKGVNVICSKCLAVWERSEKRLIKKIVRMTEQLTGFPGE